jgi:tRNA(fMet)-specific endonuclease VapC
MLRYMLDTNTVSFALRGKPPAVRARLNSLPMAQVCISVITEAELRFGVALKPSAAGLAQLVERFCAGVSREDWSSAP